MTDKTKNDETDNPYDIFIANSVFPDAKSLFATGPQSLQEIKTESIVVLDTNVLLVPFTTGKKSLEEIHKTFENLVKEKRLYIPGQVAREFVKNRARKLSDLHQQLTRKKQDAPQLQKGSYPLLDSLPEYQQVVSLEKDIDKKVEEYKKSLSNVIEHVRNMIWNDPVSLIYEKLFTGDVVFEPEIDRQNVQKQIEKNKTHKLPPEYKDSSKDDKGVGDLLIWQTILEIGKLHKKDVFFVTGDGKPDWWHKSEKKSLYPRYELVDEFRRLSNGKLFHMIPFSTLLDIFGASETVVSEIREMEVVQSHLRWSTREVDVLQLCQQGLSNEEIGDALGLNYGTIRNYLSSIYSKLDARNRSEAIQKAIQIGVLEDVEINVDEIERIKHRMEPVNFRNFIGITSREHEILFLLKDGLRNKEIADKLELSEGTVRNYISSIYEKLGTQKRLEAINKAKELGLL